MKLANRKHIVGCRINYKLNNEQKAIFKTFPSNIKKKRAYPKTKIKTLNYHGTKRAWVSEFEAIYNYVCSNFDVDTLIDCFGGSGFLSLLGARTGLFTTG